MAHVEATARHALGLIYNPDATSVRAALLRSAAIDPPTFTVMGRCEDWFVEVANELAPCGGKAGAPPETIDILVGKVHATVAPAILAIIAPQSVLAPGPNRDLPTRCKAEIRRHLPDFCARVLAQWQDGALPVGSVYSELGEPA